jgi:hypothetical protein
MDAKIVDEEVGVGVSNSGLSDFFFFPKWQKNKLD